MNNYIKELLAGFVIGVANIIPGVSGGTFALVLGLYHRLLRFLNGLGLVQARELFKTWKTGGYSALRQELSQRDYWFMFRIALGAGVGILSLSALMKYLLKVHHELTYAFFFGLILMSIAIPFRMVTKWGWRQVICLFFGVVLTAGSAQMVDPAQKAVRKSELYASRLSSTQASSPDPLESATTSAPSNPGGHYTPAEYLQVFAAGVVAVSAMVLPGISGSLILILLGQYYPVISALASLRHPTISVLLFLAALGLGVIVGLLVFARFLEWALLRWNSQVLSFLTGLVVGSLWPLWPMKRYIVRDIYQKSPEGIQLFEGVRLYTNENILSAPFPLWIGALICMLAGMVVMYFFVRKERKAG